LRKLDSKFSLPKTKNNLAQHQKNNRLFRKNNRLFIPVKNIQTEIKEFKVLKMAAAPSRHLFDEDFYVQFMYISFCFKCVLSSVLRLFKSELFAE